MNKLRRGKLIYSEADGGFLAPTFTRGGIGSTTFSTNGPMNAKRMAKFQKRARRRQNRIRELLVAHLLLQGKILSDTE